MLIVSLVGACHPVISGTGRNCQVTLPSEGTGPNGCFNKDDLQKLCRDAIECDGDVLLNGVTFDPCPDVKSIGYQVLTELMDRPGKACKDLVC